MMVGLLSSASWGMADVDGVVHLAAFKRDGRAVDRASQGLMLD
jgi:hypothetical protein